MKRCRFIQDERGSVLPLVALLIIFVFFGFTAIVVDAGSMYNSKRAMVTAADAGALAGAKEMEKTLGASSSEVASIKAKAKAIAIKLAKENGAEEEPTVSFDKINVTLEDGTSKLRDAIIVTVTKNEKHNFAQFIGLTDNNNVSAKAVATWGYNKKIAGGQILPLFMLKESYIKNENILHSGKVTLENGTVSDPNRGFVKLGDDANGMKIINDTLSGVNMDREFTLGEILVSETGQANAMISAVEDRMKKANSFSTLAERKQFMTGLIPIVTSEAAIEETPINENSEPKLKAHLNLTINYFAVYIIYDIVTDGNGKSQAKGSEFALDKINFKQIGTKANYTPFFYKGTMIGEFTGEIIELRTVITDEDQLPQPDYEGLSKYSKLVSDN